MSSLWFLAAVLNPCSIPFGDELSVSLLEFTLPDTMGVLKFIHFSSSDCLSILFFSWCWLCILARWIVSVILYREILPQRTLFTIIKCNGDTVALISLCQSYFRCNWKSLLFVATMLAFLLGYLLRCNCWVGFWFFFCHWHGYIYSNLSN